MSDNKKVIIDADTSVSHVAEALSDIIYVHSNSNSKYLKNNKDNIFGFKPQIIKIKNDKGVSGALNGSLSSGALTTAFASSDELVSMLPDLYRIAGSLSSAVIHVSASSISSSATPLLGDHSDVMAVRNAGCAMLCSNNVQEAQDFAAIAHSCSLSCHVPFIHFYDSWRTGGEIQKIQSIDESELKQFFDIELARNLHKSGLSPENPYAKGLCEDSDIFFQSREGVNKQYSIISNIVENKMEQFAKISGRHYKPFEYYGVEDALKIIIMMGSGCDTVCETIDYLNKKGEKLGIVKVRLYRPFNAKTLLASIPKSVRAIAVLDCSKEDGAIGEPLYEDVCTALQECNRNIPVVIGGRYCLGGKDFNPSCVAAVFDNLSKKRINHFSVGINDDIMHKSLSVDNNFTIKDTDISEVAVYGFGCEKSQEITKLAINMIGTSHEDWNVQTYVHASSNDALSLSVSSLRFGKSKIQKPYFVRQPDFIICSRFNYVESYEVLRNAKENTTFILNSPFDSVSVWEKLPYEVQAKIIDKKIKLFIVNANRICSDAGNKNFINEIMLVVFFLVSGIVEINEACRIIKESNYSVEIEKAVALTLKSVMPVDYPAKATSKKHVRSQLDCKKDTFVRDTLGAIVTGKGNNLCVSKLPADGRFPTGTSKFVKHAVADKVVRWDNEKCSQCGKCALVCPNSCIRIKYLSDDNLKNAPLGFRYSELKPVAVKGKKMTVGISIEDCTGCGLCIKACRSPSENDKALHFTGLTSDLRSLGRYEWEYFSKLDEVESSTLNLGSIKDLSMKTPLFEFAESADNASQSMYIKLVSQLFGTRSVIAFSKGDKRYVNYEMPVIAYTKTLDEKGIAFSGNLYRNVASYALGLRLAFDNFNYIAYSLSEKLKQNDIAATEISKVLNNSQYDDVQIGIQRKNIALLKKALLKNKSEEAKYLESICDFFIKRSIWAMSDCADVDLGDLAQALSSQKNINIMLFCDDADAGHNILNMMMNIKTAYVTSICIDSDAEHAIKAIREAESYEKSSLIVCNVCKHQNMDCVKSGEWHLFRFNPDRIDEDKNPFQLDSYEGNYDETVFADESKIKAAKRLWKEYKYLADRTF